MGGYVPLLVVQVNRSDKKTHNVHKKEWERVQGEEEDEGEMDEDEVQLLYGGRNKKQLNFLIRFTP